MSMKTLVFALLWCVYAALRLPKVITPNMVLAAERPRIFGWVSRAHTKVTATASDTGEKVTVLGGGDSYFEIEMQPRSASMLPFNITLAEEGGDSVLLFNLLAGDVWVCSGQSNMEFSVAEMFGADKVIRSAAHEGLRLFAVQKNASNTDLRDIQESQYSEGWVEATPQTVCGAEYGNRSDYCVSHCGPSAAEKSFARPTWGYFSAVCFAHGVELLRATGRPQGLIESCWGGTAIQRWSSIAALSQCGGIGDMNDEPEPPISESDGQLWAGMIVPLLPIPVRGVVWYQGEANSNPNVANKYKCQLQALIEDWRHNFARLPFQSNLVWLTVQLAAAGDSSGGVVRLAQQAATSLPDVGLAIATDLYDEHSPCGAVHIRNKSCIASRLARASLNLAYNFTESFWTGPQPKTLKLATGSVEIEFVGGQDALSFVAVPNQSKMEALQGFEVTTDMSIESGWVPVPATVKDSRLVVLNTSSAHALTGIRYSWGNIPRGEFLYDASGLPTGPFLARCKHSAKACQLVHESDLSVTTKIMASLELV